MQLPPPSKEDGCALLREAHYYIKVYTYKVGSWRGTISVAEAGSFQEKLEQDPFRAAVKARRWEFGIWNQAGLCWRPRPNTRCVTLGKSQPLSWPQFL